MEICPRRRGEHKDFFKTLYDDTIKNEQIVTKYFNNNVWA